MSTPKLPPEVIQLLLDADEALEQHGVGYLMPIRKRIAEFTKNCKQSRKRVNVQTLLRTLSHTDHEQSKRKRNRHSPSGTA